MLRLSLIFGLLFSLVTGCAGTEKDVPEKHHFILDVSRNSPRLGPEPGTVLEIRQIRVSPQYESRGFVYRMGDLKYHTDYKNTFLVSPSPMFTGEVQQWLAGSGLFQHVVDTSGRLQPTYILEGTVKALYGDYANKKSPMAILDMQFLLTQETADKTEIVFQNLYRRQIPIHEEYPDGLVSGWNEALGEILTDLENDLGGLGTQ
jgi:uncharacterized lipoprotein YmbA